MLAHEVVGSGERLVFVHGFTQTRQSWDLIASQLIDQYEVVTIDAPNHGESHDLNCNLTSGADAIVDVGRVATYVGYSMGGRLCLNAALAYPESVERLILISSTAGIDDPTNRAERIKNDEALATRIEKIGVAAFVDEWLARPMFAGLAPEIARRDLRLANTAAGLGLSLRLCGTGTQEPLLRRVSQLMMPVLVMAGENDTKFVALARQLVDAIGDNARLRIIPNSGHSPHLEQSKHFLESLREFLRSN
ncbi:MAG: alpha/beta fold hydrolase [Acidimicrobiaceae bacterium]|nr:alpha/beta fold hydrolase [Acidimicrobiaceae bacterium]